MRTPADAAFRAQARAFALVFTCEQCAAFDDADQTCAYGYPTDEHRRSYVVESEEVVFCKAFEST